jgi:hypothetical protein
VNIWNLIPRADARGYYVSPLRGYEKSSDEGFAEPLQQGVDFNSLQNLYFKGSFRVGVSPTFLLL